MLDKILARTPVNKSASMVTSQSGCDDEQSLEDQRDCLARSVQQVERELASLPSRHHMRKELGQKKFQLQSQLIPINKELKRTRHGQDLGDFIVKICKAKFTKYEYELILAQAKRDKKAYDIECNKRDG